MHSINPEDFRVKGKLDLSKTPTELLIETSKKEEETKLT